MPDLKTLDAYKAEVQALPRQTELSGIACPDCGAELDWAERGLFSTNPPMRRLVCTTCTFSEVVPIAD